MKGAKTVRLVSNIIYAIGVFIVLTLGILSLFGPNETVSPTAMLPLTYKEMAFMWLAFGTVPMLLACIAVYKFNDIKNSAHKKRYFTFLFLPGFVCSACTLFVIGVIITGYVNMLWRQ
jgi:uncharacterized membrane protein